MNTNHPSQEEKIDYIYQTLKKQESRILRATIFKWGFRIFIVLYLIYFIKIWLPLLIDSLIPSFPTMSWSWSSASNEALQNLIQDRFPNGISSESLKEYFSN